MSTTTEIGSDGFDEMIEEVYKDSGQTKQALMTTALRTIQDELGELRKSTRGWQ